jgi:uncharacterized protein
MPISETVIIAVAFVAAAALYASVGHAGASAYLAVMGLFNFAPAAMKPTALALNILVAAIGTFRFYRASLFRWSLFWPFAVVSIPAAFVGGAMTLPGRSYKIVVGVVLLYAAVWMFRSALKPIVRPTHPPPIWAALIWGATIGLLSGLTGVGGGIFLSPLLLYMGWAETRATSGVAAPFILVNSIAGLLGHLSSLAQIPSNIPVWAIAVAVGGWLGASYGSRKAPPRILRQLLSLVLVVAGAKLVLGG